MGCWCQLRGTPASQHRPRSAELHAHRGRPCKHGLGAPRGGESSRFTAGGAWLREAATGAAVSPSCCPRTSRDSCYRRHGRPLSPPWRLRELALRAALRVQAPGPKPWLSLWPTHVPTLRGSASLSQVALTSASDHPFCLPPRDPPVMRENVPASGPLITPAEPLSRGTRTRRSRVRARASWGPSRFLPQRRGSREGRVSLQSSHGTAAALSGASPQAPGTPEESGVSRRARGAVLER